MRKKRRQGKPKRTKKKENRSTTEPLGQDLPRELIAAIKPTAAHLHYSAAPTPSEEQIWARLAEVPLREIRRWLTQGERRKGLLLQQFPYLEAIGYSQPATREEKELDYIEDVIDHLKLQIAQRSRVKLRESAGAITASEPTKVPNSEVDSTSVADPIERKAAVRSFTSRKRPRRPHGETNVRKHIVQALAESNPDTKGKNLNELTCEDLDARRADFPKKWKLKFAVDSWAAGYEHREVRALIEPMFSKDRKEG